MVVSICDDLWVSGRPLTMILWGVGIRWQPRASPREGSEPYVSWLDLKGTERAPDKVAADPTQLSTPPGRGGGGGGGGCREVPR